MYVSGENSNKQLVETQTNDGFFGDQCISPPKKADFDVSKIKSFSSYSDHSVWINNDGNAFAIGNNSRSQINNTSYGKFYEKPTQIKIDGFTSSDKENLVSVVCGDNYTLYMTSTGRLIYMHEKGQGKPLFIKLKIPNPKSSKNSKTNDKYISRKPLGLFGGCNRAAVIDEEGDFYIFSEELFNSKNPMPKCYSLPESVTNVACCDTFLVALTCSGKVYGNGQINEDNDEFIEIEELSDFGPFTQISGTYEHCLALNEEGRVYGFGSNYKGRLSLDSEMRTVDTFVLLTAFDDLKVYGISAGFNHSLFLMKQKELASCGTNSYGELLAIKPTKDCYYTPIKTKIIADTKIPYFIAGCNTSFAFVDCDAPPNCPNKNIDLKKKRILLSKSEKNDPNDLTSSVRKKIENSKSNKYSKDKDNDNNDNNNKNSDENKKSESNKENSTEVKALQDKVNELTAALQKSEEEKTIVIKKLLELTQIADQLHSANKELAEKVLKYELTLGFLAVVANASSDSDDTDSDDDDDDENEEKERKEKEEKERKEKEEKERKEKEEKERKEKEEKERKEKEEKERKEKERKEKERREKERKERQRKEREKKREEKETQTKKKQQDSNQKSSEEENKEKTKQKSNENENKQKQTDQKDQQQQQQKQQKKSQQDSKSKSNEEEPKQKHHRKQTDQKNQQDSKSNENDDDENKQKQKHKQSNQKVRPPEEKQQQQQQQTDESENSNKHRPHRHRKNNQQEKQNKQEKEQEKSDQQQQQKKKPKEPSENSNENDQNQNKKHAPRRRHHHEKQQQQDNNSNNNSNSPSDDAKNNAQKSNAPPSMLAQKENEQKKSIIRPSVSKK